MEQFRIYLQKEFERRSGKNPAYSLRSFAKQMGTSHTTLSTVMAGKRKLSRKAFTKMARALGLSPADLSKFTGQVNASQGNERARPYYLIHEDSFSAMADWHYDAILELSQIKGIDLNPNSISGALRISPLKAKLALETLERLDLIFRDKKGRYKLANQNTTVSLDPDFTTAAKMKYQKAILEKSLATIDSVPRSRRDHSSTTMAIREADLPEVKKLIQGFRHKLNGFLQREESSPDQVFQLQVSFFPLTDLGVKK